EAWHLKDDRDRSVVQVMCCQDKTGSQVVLTSRRFGGFGEGVERFDCGDTSNLQTLAEINAAIARAPEQGSPPIILLIGSTDPRLLSSSLQRRFGSNAGLARARVTEVERCLHLQPEPQGGAVSAPEIIQLTTGPSYTPETPDPAQVAATRQAD